VFLKKIQLSGFKSFADKVSLPIDAGITGIVGPNGSGKSNIIDAARWVMGEQNAKNLRGKIATDIIFSGSASRKALGMAEVSLVFDNSEASSFCPAEYRHEPEISLTRRLYIDGEREYLINKKPCRLKDIVNFFSASGLGGRSYSMIQQGQVDRILNAKPEEVRIIIEEAAGTLIYKTRRDDAVKKLEKTRENLSRVEDIVTELEKQRSGLQSQMENATKWRDYSAELKSLELELFGKEHRRLMTDHAELQQLVQNEQEQEAQILAAIARLEAAQAQVQNSLDEVDPGLEGLREEVSLIRERIVRAEGVLSTADDRIDGNDQKLKLIDEDIDQDQKVLVDLETRLQGFDDKLSQTRSRLIELREFVENFADELARVDSESEEFKTKIEDLNEEYTQYDRMLENNNIRCESIARDREKTKDLLAKEELRQQELLAEISQIRKELDLQQADASQMEGGLAELIAQQQDLSMKTSQDEVLLDETKLRRDELKERYLNAKAKQASIMEMFERTKPVDPDLLKDAGALGILADLVSFNDHAKELPAFAKAAFERFSERVVLDSYEDLGNLIQMAHQNELTTMTASVLAKEADLAECERWAAKNDALCFVDYVNAEKSADRLQLLLQRVYYLPAVSLDESDMAQIPQGCVVITAKGVLATSGHDICVVGKDVGLLSLKEESAKIQTNIEQLQEELAKEQSIIDGAQMRMQEQKLRLREIEDQLKSSNTEVLEVTRKLQGLKQSLDHKVESKELSEARIEGMQHDDRNLVKELASLGEARITYGEEKQSLKKQIEELEQDFSSIDDRRSEVFKLHEARKIECATLEEREQSLASNHSGLTDQITRIQTTLSRRYDERQRTAQDSEQIKADLDKARAEIGDLLQRREELETQLGLKREENAALIEQLRRYDKELKTEREKLSKVEKFVSVKTLELERLKTAAIAYRQQADERYHVDITTLELIESEDYDAQKSARHISRLKQKIEDLGAINMMAIEEYDELIKRLEFIEAQRTEVLNSIALIEDALEEIEATTERKFTETFTQVNAEFQSLFPILFPNGEAHLEMTEPDDPLNSGVDILARLPGKRYQRMTLLSGGEKALTAISLIFALLKTKPTPFCFLDEVDAPLDEANVGRYNRVLETLSEKFQFIVITHNRRTMEVLDTLYGVTMQEPGVSKVVGVDMKKDIPDHLKKAFKDEGPKMEARSGASAEV
jgi:chromosome segregation protein